MLHWIARKNWKIFSKKNLLLPIHQDHHWSLTAIYNADNVTMDHSEDNVSAEVPFILFLDPLDRHP